MSCGLAFVTNSRHLSEGKGLGFCDTRTGALCTPEVTVKARRRGPCHEKGPSDEV